MLLQSEDSEAGKIYEGLTYSVQQCEMYYYMVTSALDFCIDVAENQSEETQKFFEYTSSQWSGQTIVVVVDKQKGKSVYQTKMYYIYGDNVNYSNIVNNEDAIMSHNYSISRNKNDGRYDFSDSKNNIVGNFLFDAPLGKAEISLNYVQEDELDLGIGKITYNTKTSLYNYTNNYLGSRRTISVSSNGVTDNLIQECLCKDYYKAMKIGYIKNEDLYVDMEKTTEEKIGTSNSGDRYGFEVLYTNTSDISGEKTKVNPYGIFPELLK